MADWKKVVVSGSNISQLTNDAGYIASIGGGILSASAAGTDQGQIKLNGVDLDINGLGTTDTPTFAGVTASLEGNVKGDLTGTADTASYVQVGSIDGDITAVTASLALAAETLVAGATGADLTLTGDLTVQGTTTTIETANLNVEDQFITLNDGGSSADGGLVIEGAGASFGWDNSAGRWAFDYSGATEDQTTIDQDAYAAAVVTTDDANYQKNGNIRITAGDIFIYVE